MDYEVELTDVHMAAKHARVIANAFKYLLVKFYFKKCMNNSRGYSFCRPCLNYTQPPTPPIYPSLLWPPQRVKTLATQASVSCAAVDAGDSILLHSCQIFFPLSEISTRLVANVINARNI